ncbi:phosphoribosyltransferase [Mesorhizobium ciceri]|uniref:phosphoribosyltransferase n=1 Tax=Mesorhizobium ciceri TaxID=39645 RepID=UPI003756771B
MKNAKYIGFRGWDMNRQSELLSQFPPSLHDSIIEFWRHVSTIDADYIVFLARKSLRLYDLFTECGFPRTERVVLSDHVIDFAPERFRGKRIALVDDTLILGTTLRRTVDALLVLGASDVSVHVMFADEKYWIKSIIDPDHIGSILPHDVLLNFCNASVVALQTRAIPYLTDFPMFRRLAVGPSELNEITSLPDWRAYTISGSRSSDRMSSYYSLLPSDELRERFNEFVAYKGTPVDILKVRLFVRHSRTVSWLRVVPIVTLASIQDEDATALLEQILDNATEGRAGAAGFLPSGSAIANFRHLQFFLSLIAGKILASDIAEVADVGRKLELDLGDGARHFGPWSRRHLVNLASTAELLAEKFQTGTSSPLTPEYRQSSIPAHEYDISSSDLAEFTASPPAALRGKAEDANASRSNLLVDLMRTFVRFYYKYELPAREETKKLGSEVLTAPVAIAPHRDRLNYGLSWSVLAADLFPKGKRLTARRRDLLSLSLDHLIDWGIAVPILAHRDGVIFRAYRHGEDVAFSDQEIALIYDIVDGYLAGAKASTVGKLVLEKLMACLMRVGAAREFLEVVHGIHGNDGVVRIGYHLHGAVPFFRTANTYLADNKDSWLSTYVIEREVVIRSNSGIALGTRPDAALYKASAASSARRLGWLLGKLREDPAMGDAKFSLNDLIVLASCAGPKDLTGALIAEARILSRWLAQVLRPHASRSLDTNGYALLVRDGRSGYGMTALNSARLKFNAYVTGRFDRLIEQGGKGLSNLPEGDFLAESWKEYWIGISKWNDRKQKETFERWINILGQNFLNITIDVFMILSAAIYGQQKQPRERDKDLRRLLRQFDEIVPVFRSSVNSGASHDTNIERLRKAMTTEQPIEKVDAAIAFSLQRLAIHLASLGQTANQAADVIDNFGNIGEQMTFPIVLWYDIIDSTGQKGGLTGDKLVDYKRRVKAFKQQSNGDLRSLKQRAKDSGATIHATYGNLESEDDEKHIFFGNANTLEWAWVTLQSLTQRAKVNDVRFRAILAPTGFAGAEPYRYDARAEVEGRVFWENFKRLKTALRTEEDKVIKGESRVLPRSCLWLCEWQSSNISLPPELSFEPVHRFDVRVEMDDFETVTSAEAGWIG